MSLVTENLGPLVVIAAVLLGGCALRAVDRFDTRCILPAARVRRGTRAHPPVVRVPPAPYEFIALGQVARWDDATVERIMKEQAGTDQPVKATAPARQQGDLAT